MSRSFATVAVLFAALPCPAQSTSRASLATSGGQGDYGAWQSAISNWGGHVAFTSGATNLGGGNPTINDVFVRDLALGVTQIVSLSTTGVFATIHCYNPSVSCDGRYVTYTTTSALVPNDTNNEADIFVRDVLLGTTTRVSVSSNGTQADLRSLLSSISADGRYVAFNSYATNLVPGDTNNRRDVFVRDRLAQTTERVSLDSNGAQALFSASDFSGCENPSLSADGRFVAFDASALNLVPADTNGVSDVFVRDRVHGVTARVSLSSSGVQANDASTHPAISGDGRWVAFLSHATNLVANDTNGALDVFVHDRVTGITRLASVSSAGVQADAGCASLSISPDGRFVVFKSAATNLVPGDTNGGADVFLRDVAGGTTTRISVGPGGLEGDDFTAQVHEDDYPTGVSLGGARATFISADTNLVAGDSNNASDAFVSETSTPCPMPTAYCTALANSTGVPAAVSASGFSSFALNDLVLTCTNLPVPSTCLFFFGTTPIDPGVPFGNGVRCVGGALRRLGAFASAGGVGNQAQDFGAPQYLGVQPGDVRYFECWYRDPTAGGALYNASDALTVTFCD